MCVCERGYVENEILNEISLRKKGREREKNTGEKGREEFYMT